MAIGVADDVVRRYQIVAGLDPPTPVTLIAAVAFGAVADEVELYIPLPAPLTMRTKHIQLTAPHEHRDMVKCMGTIGAGAMGDL